MSMTSRSTIIALVLSCQAQQLSIGVNFLCRFGRTGCLQYSRSQHEWRRPCCWAVTRWLRGAAPVLQNSRGSHYHDWQRYRNMLLLCVTKEMMQSGLAVRQNERQSDANCCADQVPLFQRDIKRLAPSSMIQLYHFQLSQIAVQECSLYNFLPIIH